MSCCILCNDRGVLNLGCLHTFHVFGRGLYATDKAGAGLVCRLENGFVLVESSACVDPDNYDHELGVKVCMDKIKNKLWELEGYMLQSHLAK